MRIAFSGTHQVGKTTLLEAVAARSPSYRAIEEPYRLLEDEGYELSDPPTREDFERQLRRSIEAVAEAPRDALLDRCPLDFAAYLRATDGDFELDDWRAELAEAMESLDLIVVVPLERPDRITLPSHEDRRLRRQVDEWIQAMVLEDLYGFGKETIEVRGDVDARVQQVLRAMC
jgi:predicted ATPase